VPDIVGYWYIHLEKCKKKFLHTDIKEQPIRQLPNQHRAYIVVTCDVTDCQLSVQRCRASATTVSTCWRCYGRRSFSRCLWLWSHSGHQWLTSSAC